MQQFMIVERAGRDVKFSDIGKVPYARISIADDKTYCGLET